MNWTSKHDSRIPELESVKREIEIKDRAGQMIGDLWVIAKVLAEKFSISPAVAMSILIDGAKVGLNAMQTITKQVEGRIK